MKKQPQAVELGDRAKDAITGLGGIVSAITNFLYGCRRIAIQPESSKDGKIPEMFVVDEPQTIVVKKGVHVATDPGPVLVELGDRVKDKISGLSGIAVGISQFVHGKRRIGIQPEMAKDGKPADTFVVDEPLLEVVKKAAIVPPHVAAAKAESKPALRNHGPRQDFVSRPGMMG